MKRERACLLCSGTLEEVVHVLREVLAVFLT